VIWPHFDLSRLFGEKLGIKYKPIKSTEMKDMGSMARPLTEKEAKILQALVEEAHDQFVEVVAEGRSNLTEDQVRKLANGSVYTAKQSKENGLVDEVGYFRDAVKAAKKLCALEKARIVEYKRRPGLMDVVFGVTSSAKASPFDGMLPGTPMYLWSRGLPVKLWDARLGLLAE
jgi:protease-4